MSRLRSRRIPGIFSALSVLVLAACNYGFQGGGGFPSDVRTIYIEPFDNQTVQTDLDVQLFRKLQDRVPRALGGRPGGEENADAVIRGRILRYEDVGQNYLAGNTQQNSNAVQILTNQVSITVSVEIINRKTNEILWDSQGVVGRGEWRTQSEKDTDGRERALNHIIQQIIDGAQSQW